MRGSLHRLSCGAVLALAIAGCEGDLAIGDMRPSIDVDGGVPPIERDANPADPDAGSSGVDAGLPGVDAGPPRVDAGPPGCGTVIEQEELRLTNLARADEGLGPLACDEALTRAARLHSQDMCDQGYFSHDSLDGRTFRDRIDAQGVSWSRIGENIARGQRTPADVHAAWMGSAGHRANILNGAFGRIGIGHVECPGSGPYWTQDFAD